MASGVPWVISTTPAARSGVPIDCEKQKGIIESRYLQGANGGGASTVFGLEMELNRAESCNFSPAWCQGEP